MSDTLSKYGYEVYKKPLRKKRYGKKIFFALLILIGLAIVALLVYLALPAATTASSTSTAFPVYQMPAEATSIVQEDGSFISGLITNRIDSVNVFDAKPEGLRAILPMAGNTMFKDMLTVYLFTENTVSVISLNNMQAIRAFRFNAATLETPVDVSYSAWERMGKRIVYEPLFDSASLAINDDRFSFSGGAMGSALTLTLENKCRLSMRFEPTLSMLQWMINWSENRAYYNSVRVSGASGSYEIPGSMITFSPNDTVIAYRQAGLSPLKHEQDAFFAALYGANTGERIVIAIVKAKPNASAPSEGFYLFRDRWEFLGDFIESDYELTRNDTYIVRSETGAFDIVFTKKDETRSKDGVIFPQTKRIQEEGTVVMHFPAIAGNETFTGVGARTRYKAAW